MVGKVTKVQDGGFFTLGPRKFDHAVKQLRRPDGLRWVEIADASGYYDQAHLIHDFREFAGLTPGEFLAR